MVHAEKNKLPIAYSRVFQNQLERKRRRRLFDETMHRIDMTFEIADKELLKITTDFEHDTRYYHLEEEDHAMAQLELKRILEGVCTKIKLIHDKMAP